MSVCLYILYAIYSFTPILMKFCTLDLQNKKKIVSTLILQKPTPTTIFNPVLVILRKKTNFI
jgi:hypothetical protein